MLSTIIRFRAMVCLSAVLAIHVGVVCFLLPPSLHAETIPLLRVSAVFLFIFAVVDDIAASSNSHGNFPFHYIRVYANGSEKWQAVATAASQYRRRIGVLQAITPQAPRPRPIPCLCAISSYQVPKWTVFTRGKRDWLLFRPGWEVLPKMLPILLMVYLYLTCIILLTTGHRFIHVFFPFHFPSFSIDNRRIRLLRDIVVVCPTVTGRSGESLA